VILVSGEEKPDWWHKSDGQPLYPRFELFDEYRRASGGCSFHIVSFSQFLELYGASGAVVEEVRQTEIQENVAQATKLATASTALKFPFTVNSTFQRYSSHPITIPKIHHDQLVSLGLVSENVVISCQYGTANGHVYYGVSGWGPYYQILVRGGNRADDPLANFALGQLLLVEMEKVNDAVQVRLSPFVID
jgi:hypothetical protein